MSLFPEECDARCQARRKHINLTTLDGRKGEDGDGEGASGNGTARRHIAAAAPLGQQFWVGSSKRDEEEGAYVQMTLSLA